MATSWAGPVFEARYDGTCPACEGHISPGDDVRYVDGEVEHAAHPETQRPVTICQTCFLAKPCECDEV
jgi:hypothetical protein